MKPLHMVRRATDGTLEQVGDGLLKDSVCLEADGVLVTFGFEVSPVSADETDCGY